MGNVLASGSVLSNYTYTYDLADRMASKEENGVVTTYAYDATNQLTGDGSAELSYDATGNRTMAGYQTGPNNQLLSDGTWTYVYDGEGNRTEKIDAAAASKWVYYYDVANRLTRVERQDMPEVGPVYVELMARFEYDVFGRRIEREVDADGGGPGVSELTRFSYDGANIWADLDASGSLATRRLFGDGSDEVWARIASVDVGWYLTDHLGSVRAISDHESAFIYEASYDAFGNRTAVVNEFNGDRYGWTGREYEAVIGLQYNRARWYDHATGQWLSEDPIGFDAGDYNLRRYVGNNPTNAKDPDGLDAQYLSRIGDQIREKDAEVHQWLVRKRASILQSPWLFDDVHGRWEERDGKSVPVIYVSGHAIAALRPSEEEAARRIIYIVRHGPFEFRFRRDTEGVQATIGPVSDREWEIRTWVSQARNDPDEYSDRLLAAQRLRAGLDPYPLGYYLFKPGGAIESGLAMHPGAGGAAARRGGGRRAKSPPKLPPKLPAISPLLQEVAGTGAGPGAGAPSSRGGTVTYFRVQGGTPPAASRQLIQVDSAGNVTINRGTLNVRGYPKTCLARNSQIIA